MEEEEEAPLSAVASMAEPESSESVEQVTNSSQPQMVPLLTSEPELVLLLSMMVLAIQPFLSMVELSKPPQLSELVLVELLSPPPKTDGADMTPEDNFLLTVHQDSHVSMAFAPTSMPSKPNSSSVMPLEIDSLQDPTHSSRSTKEPSLRLLMVTWLLTECK